MAYIGNSPANVGSYQEVDTISTFNGSLTSFALTAGSSAISPAKSGQLLVSLNGVMQEPDDTGTNGFKVSGSNIVFSSAPATGSTFWAMFQGNNVDVGTPSAGVVGLTELSATGTKSSTTYLSGANTWTTPYTHPTTAGNKHIPTGGATDQYLKYDSSGTAVWADVSGGATGAGGDKVFMENELVVTTNYTLSTNKSALSVGPIQIDTGISVTIPTGHTWVIL
jgi:hypothetical protein